MNTPSVRIALPKLFLWSEAARIQEYPEAASRAEPGRVYSRADLERVVFDIAPTMEFKGGSPRGKGTDGVINTYGMVRSGARYRINGVVVNMPDFAEAFSCKPGQPMVKPSANVCRVW